MESLGVALRPYIHGWKSKRRQKKKVDNPLAREARIRLYESRAYKFDLFTGGPIPEEIEINIAA